jgi:hypothetical protein
MPRKSKTVKVTMVNEKTADKNKKTTRAKRRPRLPVFTEKPDRSGSDRE